MEEEAESSIKFDMQGNDNLRLSESQSIDNGKSEMKQIQLTAVRNLEQ